MHNNKREQLAIQVVVVVVVKGKRKCGVGCGGVRGWGVLKGWGGGFAEVW